MLLGVVAKMAGCKGSSSADTQDFHPIEDPPRLARVLRKQWREGSSGISDGFRVG